METWKPAVYMNFSPYLLYVTLRATGGTDSVKWRDKGTSVTVLCTEGMCIHFRYSAFCFNLMRIIGRTDLINFRCLAVLLAQQAVQYEKQSKQSALISSNVPCCFWDISLIELSKRCYCSNCSNIQQLTHKHNHSTDFLPSHTVFSSVGTRSRLQKSI